MAIDALNPLLQFVRDHEWTELENGGPGEPGPLKGNQILRDIRQEHSDSPSRPRTQLGQGACEAAGTVDELSIAEGPAEKCASRPLGKTLGSRFQQSADGNIRIGQRRWHVTRI